MPCQLWMADGKLLVDDNGVPYFTEECPCGECCEGLWNKVAAMLSQMYTECISCSDTMQQGCGDCNAGDDPLDFIPGRRVNKAVNPLVSFTAPCSSGFEIVSTPASGGDSYEQDEMVLVEFCNNQVEVPFSYTDAVGVSCRMIDGVAERCTMFANAYCDKGDRMLYPVIPAPDPVSTFSNPSTLVCQEYWQSCFETTPYMYVKCAVQIIAARDTFDDYTGEEPDDTLVWGVWGCFCEGNDRWVVRRLGGAGNGLIVVNAPFEAELTDKLDANDQPILDENDEPIQVVKCAITCQGQKDMVEEMLKHYGEVYEKTPPAVRATVDPNEWEEWTGEVIDESCFWGYVPFSIVYGYVCDHLDDEGEVRSYNHWIAFGCDCELYEIESEHTSGISLPDSGIYEAKNDVCDDCPAIWALLAYAQGEGWSLSQSTDDDPRASGDGGVIIQKDSRDLTGNIYAIGGSPTYMAAWGTVDGRDYLIWIDCDCEPHVECDGNKRFLAAVDPCICVDWRELVYDNQALFGVSNASWGSHTYVEWTHTDASKSFSGPYWLYGGIESNKSANCDPCDPTVQSPTWVSVIGGFIDYNMLVVCRSVGGEYEIGHVQKGGGILNYRLQQAGASMQGITSAQVSNQNVHIMDGNFDPGSGCSNPSFLGWALNGYRYRAYCMHGTSIVWCDCDETQWGDDAYLCEYAKTHPVHPDMAFFLGNDAIGDVGTLPYSQAKRVYQEPRHQETDCRGNCHWEPPRDNWSMFQVQYLPTSCGLMVVTSSGNIFLPSITISGYSGLEQWARAQMDSMYHFYGGYTVNDYPYADDETVYGMTVINEVRNNRGTLISEPEIRNAPANVQPLLCHGSKCNLVSPSYASMADYCNTHGQETSCETDDPFFPPLSDQGN